jgi:hypothetical protein
MTQRVIHAPESGRFYDRDGNVVLEVPCKSREGFREPTVTDARKNGWLPSVTEIIKSLSRKYLDAWKTEHLLRVALDNPLGDKEDPNEWIARVAKEAEVYASLAADRGTEIHGQIKEYFVNDIVPPDSACRVIATAITERYSGYTIRSEVPFASQHGWGGCIDLLILQGSEIVCIADLKTREIQKFKHPGFDMGLQLGGYALAHDSITIKTESVIADRESGQTEFYTWGDKWKRTQSQTTAELAAAFEALFNVWCSLNRYDPRSA